MRRNCKIFRLFAFLAGLEHLGDRAERSQCLDGAARQEHFVGCSLGDFLHRIKGLVRQHPFVQPGGADQLHPRFLGFRHRLDRLGLPERFQLLRLP
ncbi:hypothetical protein D3C81_2003100 [compost metagenome]